MSEFIKVAKRVSDLPPYIFSEINNIKAQAEKKGIKLLSLGIGDPDQPTPRAIVERFIAASRDSKNHVYSPYEGTKSVRTAFANWFETRFGVSLNPANEIVSLIGSKEGIAHFPIAFCNPGDKCLYPSPGYPVYLPAISLAGGNPIPFPLRSSNGFVPDVGELEQMFVLHKPKFIFLNFPSNPTSAVCSKEILTEIVFLAKKYAVIIVHDNAYSEIYFEGTPRPPSILEAPGSREVAIEFHSLSKTFNMTGWRLGFAVGNSDLVAGLLRVKTNIDSGPLLSVQEASIYALEHAEELSNEIRKLYEARRKIMLAGLSQLGIEFFPPQATFYVWAKVPSGGSSMEFTKALIDKQGLVVTPGIGFGEEGESFFRMALTVGHSEIEEALHRLERFLKNR